MQGIAHKIRGLGVVANRIANKLKKGAVFPASFLFDAYTLGVVL